MSHSIPASESSSLRSGLCIDIPTHTSPSFQVSKTSPTSRARSVNTFSLRSKIKPGVVRTASESDSNASNMRPLPMSSSHLLRSSKGMQGLLLAETGGGLVELDSFGSGSGFKQGTAVVPGLVTPGGTSGAVSTLLDRQANLHSKDSKLGGIQRLSRHATLLTKDVLPARNAAELKSLLGNSRLKIKSGAKLLPPSKLSHQSSTSDQSVVTLEQGKSRARVEVDILLDTDTCVEGGYLTGRLHVRVRSVKAKEAMVLMAEGKMRIVGFEGIPDNDDRHTFYQHAAHLSTISASSHILYSTAPDEEGFSQACEGQHVVPFAMKLPVSEDTHLGAKGPFNNRSGVWVKYIAIASFKLKDPATSKHSIAHFYRSCEIYPYFKSTLILAPTVHPLLSAAARNIFLGGPGKLKLTANLHRNVWVAGQRCCVGISVDNESRKAVRALILSLIRTTTIFRSRPHLDVASSSSTDLDACETTTTRKLVAETTLEAGQRGLRGHVTEKGWWVGVDPGEQVKFTHSILLPHDTLSIVRSRLVEVSYAIRISLVAGSLSSEVSVMLPLRIINNLSIDPPPSYPFRYNSPGVHAPVPPPPVAVVGSEPASCNSQQNANFLSERKGVMLDLEGRTSVFKEVITRGGTSAVAIADALHGCIPTRPQSYIMPKLEEDGTDLEDTGHCSSVIFSSCPGSDAYEDSTFYELLHGSAEENFSDDIEGDDAMDEETVDDFATNLLENLNSEEEVVSFLSIPGADEHDGNDWKTTSELSETENYHNKYPETIVSAKTSGKVIGHRKIPEYTSSRLPRNRAREKITAITDSRANLRSKAPPVPHSFMTAKFGQDPAYKVKPALGSSEGCISTNFNDETQTSKTLFSQRVEKLLAAHRAATLTNSVTATETERSLLVNVGTHNDMSLPNQRSSLTELHLCELRSSTSSMKCPSTLTSSTSKIVISDSTTMGASHSGTVRSRIAALEGRTVVTVDRLPEGLQGRVDRTDP